MARANLNKSKKVLTLIQILGLLGMYLDAVVVEFQTFYFYSEWLWPYCLDVTIQPNEPDQLLKEVKFPKFSEENTD